MKGTPKYKSGNYSPEEIAIIINHYPQYGGAGQLGCVARILEGLGISRTAKSVNLKALKLGVVYLGEKKGIFSKNNPPHNKGKKMPISTYEKVSKTFFKKGQQPKNTKFDGALSFRKDSKSNISYWYIRLAKSKWVLLNRYLFEQHHNMKLKPSDIVRFKDGNQSNLTIENLELISRTKNLFINNPRLDYSEEILSVMDTLNTLNKKIIYATKQIDRLK